MQSDPPAPRAAPRLARSMASRRPSLSECPQPGSPGLRRRPRRPRGARAPPGARGSRASPGRQVPSARSRPHPRTARLHPCAHRPAADPGAGWHRLHWTNRPGRGRQRDRRKGPAGSRPCPRRQAAPEPAAPAAALLPGPLPAAEVLAALLRLSWPWESTEPPCRAPSDASLARLRRPKPSHRPLATESPPSFPTVNGPCTSALRSPNPTLAADG
mmetsp:Transcript_58243/g.161016  ORF Transcript_58243/g.161016 Transcript_58243/m.161016 type:complete len:215 (+) Transcript_58243:1458-2102(+)